MGPVKAYSNANKVPESINPWSWAYDISCDQIQVPHVLMAYRLIGYEPCQETHKRNCKKNPLCLFGLGERYWTQDGEDEENPDNEDGDFREEGEFAGLQNLGATCYVNSLLQLWFHNPIIRPAILQWTPKQCDQEFLPSCAISQLQAMFARMKLSKRSKIDPSEFVRSLGLDTAEQQDAQEFSKLFLDVIIRLLGDYEDTTISNLISNAFMGTLQNETECLGCHNITARQESFNELELTVQNHKNLSSSFSSLLADELLQGSEQYFCSKCNKKQNATRRCRLIKLPPVLNLQLMRFIFDRETFQKKKVNQNFQFPDILDMSSRLQSDSGSVQEEANIYYLTAVLIHYGATATSGHYTARVKDIRTGLWHKFNDEAVNQVYKKKSLVKEDEDQEVSSELDKKPRPKKHKSNNGNHFWNGAYMLVYTKKNILENPPAEPDLPKYLVDLVKKEDQSYEDEVTKAKNLRDVENAVKENKKMHIREMYEKFLPIEKSMIQKTMQKTQRAVKSTKGDIKVESDCKLNGSESNQKMNKQIKNPERKNNAEDETQISNAGLLDCENECVGQSSRVQCRSPNGGDSCKSYRWRKICEDPSKQVLSNFSNGSKNKSIPDSESLPGKGFSDSLDKSKIAANNYSARFHKSSNTLQDPDLLKDENVGLNAVPMECSYDSSGQNTQSEHTEKALSPNTFPDAIENSQVIPSHVDTQTGCGNSANNHPQVSLKLENPGSASGDCVKIEEVDARISQSESKVPGETIHRKSINNVCSRISDPSNASNDSKNALKMEAIKNVSIELLDCSNPSHLAQIMTEHRVVVNEKKFTRKPGCRRKRKGNDLLSSSDVRRGDDQSKPKSLRLRDDFSIDPINVDIFSEEIEKLDEGNGFEFVPSSWLCKFYEPDSSSVPPIENKVLLCRHQKLSPPLPSNPSSSVPYKVVSSDFVDQVLDMHGVTCDIRLKGLSALCVTCVKVHCKRLQLLQELDEDYRAVQESIKEMDKAESKAIKCDELYYWVSKQCLKSWKKISKRSIEDLLKITSKMDAKTEETEEVSDGEEAFNSAIKCPHGALIPDDDGNSRRLIPEKAFKVLRKYFQTLASCTSETLPCKECLVMSENLSKAASMNKETASKHKQALPNLYHLRYRPDPCTDVGKFFLIPYSFFYSWRKFVREPTKNQLVQMIDNESTLCKHKKVMYPVFSGDDVDDDFDFDKYVLLLPEEWILLTTDLNIAFSCTIIVNIIDAGNACGYSYDPDFCDECWTDAKQVKLNDQLSFDSGFVRVMLKDKTENGFDSETFEDPVQEVGELSTKKDKEVSGSMNGVGTTQGPKVNAGGIRRSGRTRRLKNDKTYKISSADSISSLKKRMIKDFHALPMDQHLFYRSKELKDDETFFSCRIPSNSVLLLEIDTPSGQPMSQLETIPELGFQGTLLQPSSSVMTPFLSSQNSG